jgi:HD-GYP domain-containing protein (c-di-GMP phosphodiesterase class II)
VAEIARCSGSQFDPVVVKAFVVLIREAMSGEPERREFFRITDRSPWSPSYRPR